jgi:hypothetical protein
MKKIDKTVLKAFKKNATTPKANPKSSTDEALIKQALEMLRTDSVKTAVHDLYRYLGAQANQPFEAKLIDNLRVLVSNKLLESAEYVFIQFLPQLENKELGDVMPLLATPLCVSKWLAVRDPQNASKRQAAESLALQMALQKPEAAVCCALARWFVETAPTAQLPTASAFFGLAAHTSWTYGKSELIHAALKADKDGSFLLKLLQDFAPSDRIRRELMSSISEDDSILDEVLRTAPNAAAADQNALVAGLVESLFASLPSTSGSSRRKMCAHLLDLAGALMAKPASLGINQVLIALERVSQKLRETIPSDEIDTHACGLRYFGETEPTAPPGISADEAKLLVIAIRRIRDGTDPIMMLEATAANLGMTSVGVVGEIISFDPIRHQDLIGGVRPGEDVALVQKGWMVGSQVIDRAQVRPINA